ncbi:aspartate--ammonia ligase [Bacillus suaedaesalsae]|uniref:Aspartate--ammonia ligase n=1 Tax=Bacillus suaedaesalsae TaxID=2810349 RepID=A0ABS2DI94_9BACI|nr:aspartate--ammonia ligase [Bacillus suaedaesalsae]MBM6618188.1 aspartate--ammonia ligase [Bacillus suaedaesalsae]
MAKVNTQYREYVSFLNLLETEIAMKKLKEHFEKELENNLNVIKVSAPLIVKDGNGINDNLNGVERIVSFNAAQIKHNNIEIVQSLAKWKRTALLKYGFKSDEGLYTNMNAIRRDEELDELHSIYVDQWDWEKVIEQEERNLEKLKSEVKKIYSAIKSTEEFIEAEYPNIKASLPNNIGFITTFQLEEMYPDLTPKERENEIAKIYGAVFIMQIGCILPSGKKHDGRSPDYDDWMLNGDIVLWSEVLERAFEVSSMGIRVDKDSLVKQLLLENCEDRLKLEYHQSIFSEKLPLSIGGGIGQSRLCMFLLKKLHIGEVQASVWNEEVISDCKRKNIQLL